MYKKFAIISQETIYRNTNEEGSKYNMTFPPIIEATYSVKDGGTEGLQAKAVGVLDSIIHKDFMSYKEDGGDLEYAAWRDNWVEEYGVDTVLGIEAAIEHCEEEESQKIGLEIASAVLKGGDFSRYINICACSF